MAKRSTHVMILAFCGFLALMICAIPQSQGETIVVDWGGSGDFTSIQDAINNSSDGDTIRVFDGEYREEVIIHTSIHLIGNGSETTTIHGGGVARQVVRIKADNVTLEGFQVTGSNSTYPGVGLSVESNNITIQYTNCSNNRYGISAIGSNGFRLLNSEVSNNTASGIGLSYLNHAIIENTIISGNNYTGIYLSRTENMTILNNSISHHSYSISFWMSQNAMVTRNRFKNCSNGLRLHYQNTNLTISHNSFLASSYGLGLNNATNIMIHDNLFNLTYSGVYLFDTDLVTLLSNRFIDHSEYSIMVRNSMRCTLTNNSMTMTGLRIEGDILVHWNSHDVHTSNTLNGKTITYLHDDSGPIPDIQDTSQLIIVNWTQFTIGNLTLAQGRMAMQLGFVEDGFIQGNVIDNCTGTALTLWNSKNMTVLDNQISGCYFGILLRNKAIGTIIKNNLIMRCEVGIYLWTGSDSITMENNTCTENVDGIWLSSSSNCTIKNNHLARNQHGLILRSSSSNHVLHNTLSNNTDNGLFISYESYNNTIIGNTITQNRNGVFFRVNATGNEIHFNEIFANREYGINATEASDEMINATENWWGHNSGPFNQSDNPQGLGDNITGPIAFDKWETRGPIYTFSVTSSTPLQEVPLHPIAPRTFQHRFSRAF